MGLTEHVSDHHGAIMDTEGTRQHLPAIYRFANNNPIEVAELVGNLVLVGLEGNAMDLALKLASHYPQDTGIAYQRHRILLWNGQIDDGRLLLDVLRHSELPDRNIRLAELRQACAEGNRDTAETHFNAAMALYREYRSTRFLLLHIIGRPEEAHQGIANESPDLWRLAGFLYYPFFDHTRFPNLKRILESQGIERPFIKSPPYACANTG